jgi:hypothetical protein
MIACKPMLGFITLRRPGQQPSAYILIGNKKTPLRGALQLGRTYWRQLTGKSVDDIDEDHAKLFQSLDGLWEIQLSKGEFMFVDGRRSRHNRLRSGATVTLGRSHQAIFQFFTQS